ncbi:MAG: hypothetical protein HC844_15810 [Tabrizicola sp.]|nr:hypothetical protein [Tabrizicola sp.]
MKRILLSASFCVCAAALPAFGQTDEPDSATYEAVLTALPEPTPLFNPSCLAEPAEVQAEAALIRDFVFGPATAPPYHAAFDAETGKVILALIDGGVAAAPDPARFRAGLPLGNFHVEMAKAFTALGLDPASVIDVSAVYLNALWAVREGDFSALEPNQPRLRALRDQLALAELRCFHLGATGPALSEHRNQLLARIGILIDGLRSASRNGELESYQAFVRDRFGQDIEGRALTDKGFVSE